MPYVQQNEVQTQVKSTILGLLNELPFLQVTKVQDNLCIDNQAQIDFAIDVKVNNRKTTLLFETKSSGEPRIVRDAVYSLKFLSGEKPNTTPIFAAPYIGQDAQEICKRAGVNFLDLSGNCRIAFDTVLIERLGKPNKLIEHRPLKSLFSPKSSRIIRKMLLNPSKTWQVQELAEETGTSIGLVSRLKKKMEQMNFLTMEGKLRFTEPERVLKSWSKVYSYRQNEQMQVYAPAQNLEQNERSLVNYCSERGIKCGLTMFSSANRLEPFVRGVLQAFAYVDANLTDVCTSLEWKKVPSGPNFILMKANDDGVFYDLQEVDGLPLVSNIQTYLDLNSYAGRGEEAAEVLLERRIRPTW